ncbi:MAG: glycosyltransferase [Bdellovibrionales bacterium]
MKILQVMAGGEFGGAETAFVDICIALHEAGEDVVVVTRPNDLRVPKMITAGLTVYALKFGGKLDVFSKWKMHKIIKDFEPDIVQCWMSRAASFVPRWQYSMGIKRYHVVARMGGYYKMKYYRSADYFVGNTPDIARYIQDQGVVGDCVRHINNYTDIESVDRSLDRKDLDTSKDAHVIIALGRLHPVKAFDVLIDAIAPLDDVVLWIAGEGDEREALENQARELGCFERVKLLGWRDDRSALFEAADICVMPSRFEPFGNVFIQAWAQRIPLVISRSEGPNQFVHHEEDALMVDIDDADAMRDAIVRIRDDQSLALRLVDQGFLRYQSEFTKEHCVAGYLEFYHHILQVSET